MIVSPRRAVRVLSRHRQSGVGLIEVLVAVLLLSIAFLGIAALQGRSLSTNNSAMARSLATIASYSILDAMRADMDGARAGSYDRTGSSKIIANACPDASGTMAETQLGLWCAQLGQGLGAVETTTGQVACADTGATADCTITITFDDSRAGVGGSRVQTIATRAML
ncbi:type IV pilus modification protein PilV [Rhodanobacter hydrolyticus]|uniref:Type IV pilus modification protein PilV n=1 Tax=Rhodanobacter hydrolyticus TaxID=2250595 RepID=A0ABW8J3Q4_9GAMM